MPEFSLCVATKHQSFPLLNTSLKQVLLITVTTMVNLSVKLYSIKKLKRKIPHASMSGSVMAHATEKITFLSAYGTEVTVVATVALQIVQIKQDLMNLASLNAVVLTDTNVSNQTKVVTYAICLHGICRS